MFQDTAGNDWTFLMLRWQEPLLATEVNVCPGLLLAPSFNRTTFQTPTKVRHTTQVTVVNKGISKLSQSLGPLYGLRILSDLPSVTGLSHKSQSTTSSIVPTRLDEIPTLGNYSGARHSRLMLCATVSCILDIVDAVKLAYGKAIP